MKENKILSLSIVINLIYTLIVSFILVSISKKEFIPYLTIIFNIITFIINLFLTMIIIKVKDFAVIKNVSIITIILNILFYIGKNIANYLDNIIVNTNFAKINTQYFINEADINIGQQFAKFSTNILFSNFLYAIYIMSFTIFIVGATLKIVNTKDK